MTASPGRNKLTPVIIHPVTRNEQYGNIIIAGSAQIIEVIDDILIGRLYPAIVIDDKAVYLTE